MLSPEDMKHFDFDIESLDGVSVTSRRAFWNILDEARAETGFDPAGQKIFVQLFPSRDGGCEFFVTVLGKRRTDTVPFSAPPPTEFVYAFASLADLLFGCRYLAARADPPKAQAYTDGEKERFYLILDRETPGLTEFCGVLCRRRFSVYIHEHGRLLAEDAIESLAPLSTALPS